MTCHKEIKVGDTVQCIRHRDGYLVHGEFYVVEDVTTNYLYLEGTKNQWSKDRFIKMSDRRCKDNNTERVVVGKTYRLRGTTWEAECAGWFKGQAIMDLGDEDFIFSDGIISQKKFDWVEVKEPVIKYGHISFDSIRTHWVHKKLSIHNCRATFIDDVLTSVEML